MHAQYQHGGVNVIGRKFSAYTLCHVVNSEHSYNIGKDRMIVDHMSNHNYWFNGVRFHEALQVIHIKTIVFTSLKYFNQLNKIIYK